MTICSETTCNTIYELGFSTSDKFDEWSGGGTPATFATLMIISDFRCGKIYPYFQMTPDDIDRVGWPRVCPECGCKLRDLTPDEERIMTDGYLIV